MTTLPPVKTEKDLDRAFYSGYITSKKWKKTRAKAGKRKCFVCGERFGLDCHHLNYSRLGKEKAKDLIWLCHQHHFGFHAHSRLNGINQLKEYKKLCSENREPEYLHQLASCPLGHPKG